MHTTQPPTGNTRITQPENRAFFPALDGIRAVAFLLVFAHHYLHVEPGWIGVDIFFVLSGFLITGILCDSQNDPHRVRNFYIRRSLRIFPLYYAVILAIVLMTPFCHWQWGWRWLSWPLYVGNLVLFVHRGPLDPATTHLYNGWLQGSGAAFLFIGHFWSLCVEEQFYLVWPWVVFWLKSRRTLIWIASAIIVLWPTLRLLGWLYLPADRVAADILAHGTLFRVDTLMVGALIALLYRGISRPALFRAASAAIWVAGGITAIALATIVAHPALLHNRGIKPFLFTIGFTIVALFAGVLIVRSLLPSTVFYRIFSNPVLRWMGRISYGAYIFHDLPHAYYLRAAAAIHIPVALLAFACTYTLAWLSFRFFETPFLNLKERWTTR